MKPPVALYSFFHLNLAYSSIEIEQRFEVIQRCYWPLLDLAERYNLPIGIEAPGYTIEAISKLDPQWIAALNRLCAQGLVELIGSGYAQVIGPLVPAEVNAANFRIGNKVYDHLVRFRPRIALVNEQAFSTGLIQHYLDAGYRAIIMEWNNPARFHPEWDAKWRYLPQMAVGQHGEEIPIIWNKSISFQKFQRYAHGEMDLNEYISYLAQHLGDGQRAFPLYGNDVEIFDFRPGRFHTEAGLHGDGEWNRIDRLFARLLDDERFKCVSVSSALNMIHQPQAGNPLSLESSQDPIPVKKQEKYNITRWAVSGVFDLQVNTDCWKIYHDLMEKTVSDDNLKELCYLWSSDFRTHITPRRLSGFLERLEKFKSKLEIDNSIASVVLPEKKVTTASSFANTTINGQFITLENQQVKLKINCRRGLAIQGLIFKQISPKPLCMTLPHGYFDNITMGADFYSGHLVLETPGKPKITDLEAVSPQIEDKEPSKVSVSGIVKTSAGDITKKIELGNTETGDPHVKISYSIHWKPSPMGSLRLGAVTLNPEAFDSQSMHYSTHNGGKCLETFSLNGVSVNHGAPASFMVSASAALGLTSGLLVIGDQYKQLHIEIDKSRCAAIGMITHRPVPPNFFCRHVFSLMEMDETSNRDYWDKKVDNLDFEFTITASKSAGWNGRHTISNSINSY